MCVKTLSLIVCIVVDREKRSKRKRQSVSEIEKNIYRILEKKAEHASRGENEIQKKLSELETDVDGSKGIQKLP